MIVRYEDDDIKKTYGWVEGLFKLWDLNTSDELTMVIYEGSLLFTYEGQEALYWVSDIPSITQTREVFLQWMKDKPRYFYEERAKDHIREAFNLC